MNYGIQHITPSEALNREIWRWALGHATWMEVRIMIADSIASGEINDTAHEAVIKSVAIARYSK